MTFFRTEMTTILIFLTASLVLSLILFALVYTMSFTSKVDYEKSSAYECGFAPFSETTFPFEVQFALIAILFLLFDVEVLYLFPLVVTLVDLNFISLVCITTFFLLLMLGILYEVSRHILNLTSNKVMQGHEVIEGYGVVEKYEEKRNHERNYNIKHGTHL
jgi:NADH-quinone oxidoreductase subunit A